MKRAGAQYSLDEPWLKVNRTDLRNDDFTLFRHPVTRRKVHQINWYVHRSESIRDQLHGLIDNQQLHHRINVLFRNMEIDGPVRTEYSKYRYDKVADKYHCHITDGNPTYVVMWEVDEKNHVINIVDIGVHENFEYRPAHNKKDAINTALAARENDNTYQKHVKLGLARR